MSSIYLSDFYSSVGNGEVASIFYTINLQIKSQLFAVTWRNSFPTLKEGRIEKIVCMDVCLKVNVDKDETPN